MKDLSNNKIIDDIVLKYKQDEKVLGIMLFGSFARNKSDKYSDIDIYILLSEKGKYSRINFVENDIRIDIILDTIDEAKKYLVRDEYSVRRNTSHMLAHGRILYERDTELKKIQKIAKENLSLETRYSKNELLMHKYSIDDFWGEVERDIESNDLIAFGLDSQLLLNNIIELFLKLKGEFFRQPNEMSEILDKLDGDLKKEINNFYATFDIREKEKSLQRLVEYSYKKLGGPLPKKWEIS